MTTYRRARKYAPRLDFDIRQEHIDTAIPKDSGHCMIADALRDAYPHATWISVDLATIRFTDEAAGMRYIYLTPGYAQKALLDFDAGDKPGPFHLRANAAQMVLTGAAKRQRALRNRKAREEGREPEPERATVIPTRHNPGGSVPVKNGGKPIPPGPLFGSATHNRNIEQRKARADGRSSARGKRREFGLRRFVR